MIRHALVKRDNALALIKAIKGEFLSHRLREDGRTTQVMRDGIEFFCAYADHHNAQSGFPIKSWNWACMYACIAINVTRKAPKLPNENTAVGERLPMFDEKRKRTSWEVWHDGATFSGPMQLVGGLVWFKNMDDQKPEMHPNSSPGFPLGWESKAGMRHSGMCIVGNYYRFKAGVIGMYKV